MSAKQGLKAMLDGVRDAVAATLGEHLADEISVAVMPLSPQLAPPLVVLELAGVRPGPSGLVVRLQAHLGAESELEVMALGTAVQVCLGREAVVVNGTARSASVEQTDAGVIIEVSLG